MERLLEELHRSALQRQAAPVVDDPHDEAAVATYEELFPGRRILTVPGREILLGGGNVHCITQQQPRG